MLMDLFAYVSFGSMAELKEEQMNEIACGLKKSNHNFLWVVSSGEARNLTKSANFFLNCVKGV